MVAVNGFAAADDTMREMRPGQMLLLVVIALTLPGCRDRHAASAAGMSHETVSFSGCEFEVVTVDPTQTDLNLFWRQSDGSRFANFRTLRNALAKTDRRLIFATNAGIFDPSFTPVGLCVENGRELVPLNLKSGTGNFYMKPNGVFYLDSDRVIFAISREPVAFYNFAALSRDRLACPDALYLDGVISRFYLASDAKGDTSEEDFAGMPAVTARE